MNKIYKLCQIYRTAADQFDQLNSLLWGENKTEAPEKPPASAELPIDIGEPQKAIGFNVPGYNRVLNDVDAYLQKIAMKILGKIRNYPLGTQVPFTDPRNGTKYMAVLERHAPNEIIHRYHPGISLFVANNQ